MSKPKKKPKPYKNLCVSPPLHARLRKRAAEQEKTLNRMVERMLTEALRMSA